MIDLLEAVNIVRSRLNELELTAGEPLGIVENQTIERSFGWVFFYNSQRYIETQEVRFMLVGNSPLIVDRVNGDIHETGTAEPIEFYIDEYLKQYQRGS